MQGLHGNVNVKINLNEKKVKIKNMLKFKIDFFGNCRKNKYTLWDRGF